MKMVVQAKLLPSAEEALRLPATLHTCNKGADLASRVAFDKREFSKLGLQKLFPGSPGTGGARGFAHHHGGALPPGGQGVGKRPQITRMNLDPLIRPLGIDPLGWRGD
ncbi:hypothetical protein [Streptomyces sp. NPDC001222]|uniref:hypothetical protein n=1 Tax=Streptomyces sp. NPDC001222 TaxID=3364548 RepID=UPI0036D1F90C